MPASPQRRRQPGRRLRSGAQLGGQEEEEEEEWCPAATFAFPESLPLLHPMRSDKLEKMKSPKYKKLRRQTMMTKHAATTIAVASPPLSLRRTRRQSMMPHKLCSPLNMDPQKRRTTNAEPAPSHPSDQPAKAESKRKLGTETAPVETQVLPVTKRRRLVPTSKSSSHVKPSASPADTSRKHKSLSFLPVTHSTYKSGSAKPVKAQLDDNTGSPGASKQVSSIEPPVQGRKPPKKRELSPSHTETSFPALKKTSQSSSGEMVLPSKKRAATLSHNESRFVRRKSLPRKHKMGPKLPEKVATPSPKKVAAPKKRPSSVHPQAVAKKPATSSQEKVPTLTSWKESSTSLKASTSLPLLTSKNTPRKKAVAPKIPTTPIPKNALAHTPKKTPKAGSKRTPSQPAGNKEKTPKTVSKKRKSKTKTPSPGKKTQKKTPTVVSKKTPPSKKITAKKTPASVSKKVKSPLTKTPSSRKKVLSSPMIMFPNKLSPQKHGRTQSASKSRTSFKSLKVVLVKVNGKSPSSLSSFRKTPSSKKTAAVSSTTDTDTSPSLPSARMQLQRIRDTISSTQKHYRTNRTSPRKSPSLTATTSIPSLDTVVTKADIHASDNGKCSSELPLENHEPWKGSTCDPWQGSTPTARPPMPPTPKSSRGNSSSMSRFSSRIASNAISAQRLTATAPPQSSTPIKGGRTLEVISMRPSLKSEDGSGSFSESMEGEADDSVDGEREDDSVDEERADDSVDGERADDSVDGERADTSVEEESVDAEEGDSVMEESVEEKDSSVKEKEIENKAQNRRNYCTLM